MLIDHIKTRSISLHNLYYFSIKIKSALMMIRLNKNIDSKIKPFTILCMLLCSIKCVYLCIDVCEEINK